MPEEEEDLVEGKDEPMAEVELPLPVMKATVQKLHEQQKKTITLEEEGHTNVEEVMAEAKELPSSVTSATSGGTNILNVLRVNRLEKEEHMLLRWRKKRHHPKR